MATWIGVGFIRIARCLLRAAFRWLSSHVWPDRLTAQKREELFVAVQLVRALRNAGQLYCIAHVRDKPDIEICGLARGDRVGVEVTGLVDKAIQEAVVGHLEFVDVLNRHLREDPRLRETLTQKFHGQWLQLALATIPPKNKRVAVARLVLEWLAKAPYSGEGIVPPSGPKLLKWITEAEFHEPVFEGFWFAQPGLGGITAFPPLARLLEKKRDDAAGYERLHQTWLVVYDAAASAWAQTFATGPEVTAAVASCLPPGPYDRVFLFDWHGLKLWNFQSGRSWIRLPIS